MLQRATEHGDESYQCHRMSPCPYLGTNIITKIPWAGEAASHHAEDRLAMAISLNVQSQVQYDELEMCTFPIQETNLKHILLFKVPRHYRIV